MSRECVEFQQATKTSKMYRIQDVQDNLTYTCKARS